MSTLVARLIAAMVAMDPEVVAYRLVRYAALVGQETVIAGTDCRLGRASAIPKLPGPSWRQRRRRHHGSHGVILPGFVPLLASAGVRRCLFVVVTDGEQHVFARPRRGARIACHAESYDCGKRWRPSVSDHLRGWLSK